MSHAQTMEALERANDIRIGRAMIRKEIREEKVSVVDVLETEPYVCDTMTLVQLFSSQKGWAELKSERFIKGTVYNPYKKLGKLTKLERVKLINRFKENYGYLL